MNDHSERITKSEDASIPSDENSANEAFKNSISIITESIRCITFQNIKEEMFDPFQISIGQQINTIRDEVRQVGERFEADVLHAVKSSKREIVEDRIKQFNIDDLISKLLQAPEVIASSHADVQSKSRLSANAKDNYKAEVININTSVAGQGMIGENKDDRDAIIQLIEDRIINEGAFGTKVDITYQSTGRSKAVLECRDLNIERGRSLYVSWLKAEREHEDARIELEKSINQFSALKSVSSLIVSVTG